MLPGIAPIVVPLKGAPRVVQRSTTASSARVTSTAVSFSAATAGNLLVVEFLCETNSTAPSAPSGWTLSKAFVNNGGSLQIGVFTKVAAGGETSVTFTHGNNATATIFKEFTGSNGSIYFGTEVNTTTSTAPNSPSLTPAPGNKAYYWCAYCGYPTTNVSVYPSGYVNGTEAATTGSNLIRIASAENRKLAATEDPGAFTIGSSVKWMSNTYAVAPN